MRSQTMSFQTYNIFSFNLNIPCPHPYTIYPRFYPILIPTPQLLHFQI